MSYSPHSFRRLTASQTRCERGKCQCLRYLRENEQTLDKGRLPRCYSAVSSLLGHPLVPTFVTFSDPLAVHRGVVKAIQTCSTSVPDPGVMARPDGGQLHSPSIRRSSTSGSVHSVDSTKKKSKLFGIRKSASKHSNYSP